jgi:hypothetical protein
MIIRLIMAPSVSVCGLPPAELQQAQGRYVHNGVVFRPRCSPRAYAIVYLFCRPVCGLRFRKAFLVPGHGGLRDVKDPTLSRAALSNVRMYSGTIH